MLVTTARFPQLNEKWVTAEAWFLIQSSDQSTQHIKHVNVKVKILHGAA